jgi:LPXTG-motif cell wall-anchored protein
MVERLPATGESHSNPVMLLGGCILLVTLLLAFSGGSDGDPTADTDGKATVKTLRGKGGGGAGAFIPGAPLPPDMQGGGGFSDGPSVDTVETVRDIMDRLPDNRNDPEQYNPSGAYTPKPK